MCYFEVKMRQNPLSGPRWRSLQNKVVPQLANRRAETYRPQANYSPDIATFVFLILLPVYWLLTRKSMHGRLRSYPFWRPDSKFRMS